MNRPDGTIKKELTPLKILGCGLLSLWIVCATIIFIVIMTIAKIADFIEVRKK